MSWIIALLILGGVLLFLETLLPGLIVGIIGLLCLAGAVVLGYLNFGLATGSAVLGIVLLELTVGAWLWLKYFPDSRLARKFISQQTVGDLGVSRPELLNATGETLSQLRPSGKAIVNGQPLDVVTEGDLIERGVKIKVIQVEGTRIVVRPL
jgi:membrane-bound serine protease (ClpP class)